MCNLFGILFDNMITSSRNFPQIPGPLMHRICEKFIRKFLEYTLYIRKRFLKCSDAIRIELNAD
jgi:hypothetical protein